ncbi:NAD(P)/FAD-dependent oxidoreductase, partial [Actinophytocola sp.]|uniref:phytoene desaturase family protein n=1 Tax=Actinophytocola sp. TaxID=1872138 RepID=UPI002D7E744B
GPAEALRLARMFTQSVRAFGNERFGGEGGPLLLAGNAMHTDLGPDRAGGALFGWMLSMLGQDVGFPVPEGGAGRITDALVRRLEERGGRVECGRRVRRVLIANGRAVGVRDTDGTDVRAGRGVLADVPAPALYRELVGVAHLPTRMVADLDNFQWDDATVKVDWALNGPVPWAVAEAVGAGTVHLGGDVDELAGASNDLACGRDPDDPFLLIGQMTTADPSRSPAGTESLWAYTHVPRGQDWPADRVRRVADRMELAIERHAPGFRERIIGRVVVGPADFERHNPSLVEGAINAGTSALHQQLVFRPVVGLARADTPIDRLYLAGASAHPGGGVHGAPGANAARAALARNGAGGGLYRRAVRAGFRLLTR